MRPRPALRQARHEGTLRMIDEARECIAYIGSAEASQLSASTKHAAQQLAVLAQARLAACAMQASLADETPEGRSIVALTQKLGFEQALVARPRRSRSRPRRA